MPLCTYNIYGRDNVLPLPMFFIGCVVSLGGPLAVAYALRKRGAWMNALAIVPAVIISRLTFREVGQELTIYALFALCAIGLIAWGVYEARPTVINVGVLGFAANLLGFYFSQVMDKLGRSVALIGFGVIFLIGGYELEKLRRKLIARVAAEGGSHEATL